MPHSATINYTPTTHPQPRLDFGPGWTDVAHVAVSYSAEGSVMDKFVKYLTIAMEHNDRGDNRGKWLTTAEVTNLKLPAISREYVAFSSSSSSIPRESVISLHRRLRSSARNVSYDSRRLFNASHAVAELLHTQRHFHEVRRARVHDLAIGSVPRRDLVNCVVLAPLERRVVPRLVTRLRWGRGHVCETRGGVRCGVLAGERGGFSSPTQKGKGRGTPLRWQTSRGKACLPLTFERVGG